LVYVPLTRRTCRIDAIIASSDSVDASVFCNHHSRTASSSRREISALAWALQLRNTGVVRMDYAIAGSLQLQQYQVVLRSDRQLQASVAVIDRFVIGNTELLVSKMA